ncbi:MAG TPA: hypothetical protein VFP87_05295, partial [Chitinophagaceae bacterium]|nr:hypothetical protein [Chitinophagaceae bacterium]
YVVTEVHIYLNQTAAIDATKSLSLPLDQIEKIEVIEHDKLRTTVSYILGGVGITLGVITVAAVIVALTKSSCPFVSTYDGTQYVVQGELFGGATNRRLERLDYVPLRMQPINGEYQLRISNELKENQFTNFADLLVIEHDSSMHVGVGTDGHIYQLGSGLTPTAALVNNKTDVLKEIIQSDGVICKFNDTASSTATNEMAMTFPNPGGFKNAKLVLDLKNSYWFDYLYGEFTSHFGSSYDRWQEQQNTQPVEQMIRWTNEQEIPLSVSMSTPDGWKEICKITTVGPLANRQIVIPVEIAAQSTRPIRIKLSTGFMFWELDCASMDFSVQQPLDVSILKPYSAIDENGNDVLDRLRQDDDKFLTQLEIGNYATLKYKMTRATNPAKSYSVVLATKGYYEPVRNYSGNPDLDFLKRFKEPGAMGNFSKYQYQSIIRNQKVIALKSN